MTLKRRLIWLMVPALCYGAHAHADAWPDAIPDSVATPLNQALTIEVLDNDVGEGLVLTKVNNYSTQGGTAALSEDKQSVIYQPANGFTGNDEFWYDFVDNQGRANAAKVIVNVGSPIDPGERPEAWPIASRDEVSLEITQPISISVLSNDIGAGLTLKSVNAWSLNGGQISINADKQSLTYTTLIPEAQWPATDEFWYVLEDAWGRSNAAKVQVLLGYENKPDAWPNATEDTAEATKNQATKINVLANDTGIGLSLKSVNTSSVRWGTVSINGDRLLYTPRYDFTGEDEFWYVFEDAWGRTNSAKVTVDVVEPTAITLNDTGVVTCGDYPTGYSEQHNNDLTDCTAATDADGDPIPKGQDALSGRDVTNNDDSDGVLGFSYTKLNSDGQSLPADATTWSCVKDNVSGLIWESKKGKGSGQGTAGLHGSDDKYYSLKNNGGNFTLPSCFGHSLSDTSTYCYTENFVNSVNEEGLCGISNWRMPSVIELESLVNYDSRTFGIAIDTNYFPETATAERYLSSSTAAEDNTRRLGINFTQGNMTSSPYFFNGHVRLVSDISRARQTD
ncbi:DUF1566 domain-containing protein [Leucothrix sargassi]|nr:DUF1566 domain-containing protein [Leucothrix sargassi]